MGCLCNWWRPCRGTAHSCLHLGLPSSPLGPTRSPHIANKTQRSGPGRKSSHWKFEPLLLLRFSGSLPAFRIQISGHGSINITAESAFWTNGLWRRAFSVRRCLKVLGKLFERIFERKWNAIWTLLFRFFEMDKSCVPVAKLALSQKKHWHCWQSTYCIWFCSENFHCWVLPGMGLFRQHFLKTIFDFDNMWQPRIWYLDTDALGVNELVSSFFSMLLRSSTSMDARQFLQLWNTPPALHPVAKCFADSKKTFTVLHLVKCKAPIGNPGFCMTLLKVLWSWFPRFMDRKWKISMMVLVCRRPNDGTWYKIPMGLRCLWCQQELWIETLQSFCWPRIQHDTLPYRPMSTSRNEILRISNFSIISCWGKMVRFAEALFGMLTNFNHSPKVWGMSHFEFHIHFKHIKSFHWLHGIFHHKNATVTQPPVSV